MRRTLTTHGHATRSRVEALAEAQLGVLTRAQCLGLGMTASALKWMVQAGRWQRVHLGVYATHVGPLDWRARVSAAVLYCGDGAVASHSTAARLHGLAEQDPDVIEVLIPASRRVVRPGQVRLATCADLSRRTARSGWPTRTTVEDTVLDMAEQGAADSAIAWVSKACQRRRTTPARLADALDNRASHRWRKLLVDALSDVAAGVESVLEYRYVTGVERPHGLPEARRQQVVILGGRRRRTDNDYQPFGVVVELDGRLGHEGEGVFRDRSRDNSAAVSGKASLRFGWVDVDARPCEVAQDVALLLWSRGWRGQLRRCSAQCRVSALTA
jgi:predicted transcriptional regulator of viral defense system